MTQPMHPVPVELVDTYWPYVAPLLEPAVHYRSISEWNLGDLWRHCRKGDVFLFIDDLEAPKNCLTLEFMQNPTGQHALIRFLGGQGGEFDWPDGVQQVKEIARMNGCDRVLARVRPGLHKRIGGKPINTLCELGE